MALYRTYRPATFAEVVGQEHVTDPLGRALDTGRINHAYLFSGPRGCGKTSSARILARSLNCEQGPTSTPCGVCSSCVALAPGGPGNLDVIELDAASHGGVDDTRELRDRAFYAPSESRYRVFIVDEAHMVTNAGFNALLKIVEEPPEHLIFIFATTEPEKVLPTIRSRTHHYPFRLLAPPVMRGLLEKICASEGVTVAPEVFPLVIRAGGGSPRDSLSILDQLLAGAGEEGVVYDRALSLLGVTDVALIDDAIDGLAAADGGRLFATVERVVDAGHDPRRFAVDLLERLRDLILLQAVPDAVDRGLVEAPGDQLDRMRAQIETLGPAALTRFAETVHAALGEMRGTTSPRLLLEVMCARMLLPAASAADAALLQRLERLESGVVAAPRVAGAGSGADAPAASAPAPSVPRAPAADDPAPRFVRRSKQKASEATPAGPPQPESTAEPVAPQVNTPTVEPVEAAEEPVAQATATPQHAEASPAQDESVALPWEPEPVVERTPAAPTPAMAPPTPTRPEPPRAPEPRQAGPETSNAPDLPKARPEPPRGPEPQQAGPETSNAPDLPQARPVPPRAPEPQQAGPETSNARPESSRARPAASREAPVVDGIPLPDEPLDDEFTIPEPEPRAAQARPAPEPQPEPEVAAPGLDVETVRKRYQEVRSAVRERSKSLEPMLSAATIHDLQDQTVVLGHPIEVLVGRLSASHAVDIIRQSLQQVFGVELDVRTVHVPPGSAGPATTSSPAPKQQAAPRRQTFSRPSQSSGNGERQQDPVPAPPEAVAEPEEPAPPPPPPPTPDEELTDAERDEMVEQAKSSGPDARLDPEQVAMELLKSELGARPLE
ncbi:DNA polymerase III subunit gamma and tau [Gordonia sp. TBRC 11910]|uniref:DNA polymerase III subunit gamma/tau n=1 Tax=Gordonia asplenii TaxID=2725283 RepID=A0A848LC24_9ACTN|nr:DNA polymerase III subunit gamma and tau [Gordonia asplenii]NMO05118.1 DNA polymerase III subunit gamma and tau [Gordonia asplenii]